MVERRRSFNARGHLPSLRGFARIGMLIVLVIVAIGTITNAANYEIPFLNPPLPQEVVSFSVSWPPSSNNNLNALTFNGSMYLNIFLLSNGSIIQGQRVMALGTGGMTASLGKEVSQVLVTFQSASGCYLQLCGGEVIEVGGPTSVILNRNETTRGYAPVTKIGNTRLPDALGGDIYPIHWQSSGTFYPTVTLSFANGSLSQPFISQNKLISVAPADDAISERAGRFEVFLGVAAIVVAFVEIALRHFDKERYAQGDHKSSVMQSIELGEA